MSTLTIPWRSDKRHRLHEFRLDPETWVCECGLPEGNRWHLPDANFSDFWYDPHQLTLTPVRSQ